LSESVWKKPVICIFKERSTDEWQSDPFVVIKAKQVKVASNGKEFSGKVEDFFTLMGDADYLTTLRGRDDHYVMCWFDDTIPDMTNDLRRLRGVRFFGGVNYTINEKTSKRTYNATYNAKQAKLS